MHGPFREAAPFCYLYYITDEKFGEVLMRNVKKLGYSEQYAIAEAVGKVIAEPLKLPVGDSI